MEERIFQQTNDKGTNHKEQIMRWEYMTLAIPGKGLVLGGKINIQALTDRLNKHGSEGWELVSVFDTNMRDGSTRDVVAILKRPIS